MLIDAFVAEPLKQDFTTFYKARILASLLLTYSLIFVIAVLWMLFAPSVSATGLFFGSIICGVALLCFASCLLLISLKSALTLATHIAVATTSISIFCGAMLSGGPLEAPAMVMVLLPIMMAFILLNKTMGLLWTCIIMTAHIISVLLHIAGYRFPQLLPDDMLALQHLAHWLMAYAAIVALMFIFDTINRQLRSELDEERQRYAYLASHDPLTHLANRLYFEQNLNKAISRSRRNQQLFALLMIDLDKFKPINDTLGHDAGDIALCEISQRLRQAVRDIDTVARLGGDEFGIILEDIKDAGAIYPIVEKLRHRLQLPITQLEGQPSVGGSIGVAIYPTHSMDKAELLKLADTAMYCAKRAKNNWCFVDLP